MVTRFAWDVYHIENYLLDPSAIAYVVSSFGTKSVSEDDVLKDLQVAARKSVDSRVKHALTTYASRQITRSLDFSFDPGAVDLSVELSGAVNRSIERISQAHSEKLGLANLRKIENKERNKIEQAFANGSWMKSLPGREILREYVRSLPAGISYDVFKNMILRRLVDIEYRPTGMKKVIAKILSE